MLDIDAIEARANAATPGPWDGYDVDSADGPYWVVDAGRAKNICTLTDEAINRGGNAEFIAYARTDIPALIAEVRRLQAGSASSERPD